MTGVSNEDLFQKVLHKFHVLKIKFAQHISNVFFFWLLTKSSFEGPPGVPTDVTPAVSSGVPPEINSGNILEISSWIREKVSFGISFFENPSSSSFWKFFKSVLCDSSRSSF